jgi:outer membrane protein OmpA-like peptidoglycan-associated protein
MSRYGFSLIAPMARMLALATSVCATEEFVVAQASAENQRVSEIQTETNAAVAAQASKARTDISRVEEQLTTTDRKLAILSTAADQARASATTANSVASQALQQGQANSAQINATASELAKGSADLARLEAAQDYSLAEVANVTFQVNRSDLSDDAKVTLDKIVRTAAASPRGLIEVVGFADKTGSKSSNLILSQKRADAVARYLVQQSVPLKNISLIGLGKEQTPEQLAAEVQTLDPNASEKQLRGLARRVRIRLYVPGSSDGKLASR